MASKKNYLVPPEPAPINLPSGKATVTVRIIDTTTRVEGSTKNLVVPQIPGFDPRHSVPSFAFLISNRNHHVLFDLGMRKDWQNHSPLSVRLIEKVMGGVRVEKNVADILDEHNIDIGVSSKDIKAVIWSHHHWDHIGDMTTFPEETELVVGPGLLQQYTPGYPTHPKSHLLDTDFVGRKVREVSFGREGEDTLMIGSLPAMDYFGDGSFYLLHAPGHSRGHLCGLARVTSSPQSFILMAGDAAHYPGILKPTRWNPIPKTINPSPLVKFPCGCPGEVLQRIHPSGSATEPFFGERGLIAYDAEEEERSIRKIQEIDALENVLTVLAHDVSLLKHLDLFPQTANDWFAKDLSARTKWAFCSDFAEAVELSKQTKL